MAQFVMPARGLLGIPRRRAGLPVRPRLRDTAPSGLDRLYQVITGDLRRHKPYPGKSIRYLDMACVEIEHENGQRYVLTLDWVREIQT